MGLFWTLRLYICVRNSFDDLLISLFTRYILGEFFFFLSVWAFENGKKIISNIFSHFVRTDLREIWRANMRDIDNFVIFAAMINRARRSSRESWQRSDNWFFKFSRGRENRPPPNVCFAWKRSCADESISIFFQFAEFAKSIYRVFSDKASSFVLAFSHSMEIHHRDSRVRSHNNVLALLVIRGFENKERRASLIYRTSSPYVKYFDTRVRGKI